MAIPSHQVAAYKHIIPLDYASVKSVPDSFVWFQSESIPSTNELSIPVIDLKDPDATELIVEACETWGLFQLKGHGVPTKIMEDLESEARKLFDLPMEQKLKALRSPEGYGGYGIASIQSMISTFMWHEGFTVLGSAVDHAKKIWPHDYQGFCDTIDDYQKQIRALAAKIMRILLEALNIPLEQVQYWLDDDPSNSSGCNIALQLNSYPPCPEPTRTLGLASHTDTSFVTLLQARTSGLQVLKDGVGWVPVQPIPDGIIVNLGDFLHILSNGRFISVFHRVVAKPVQRYSFGYFFRPPVDFTVSPLLSKNLGSGQVARFRSLTVKEYHELKAKHLDKALSLIKT